MKMSHKNIEIYSVKMSLLMIKKYITAFIVYVNLMQIFGGLIMKNSLIKNRIDFTLWVLTVLSALIAIVSYFFLPQDIPMQWKVLEVIWYANKVAIFLFPVFCFAIFFFLKPEISPLFRSPLF